MPIEGTINSLYLDYEQTKPLFPRTKTKAISDENGVGLDATLSKIQNDLSNKATEAFVTNKIAEAQLGGGSGEGNIDLSGFATKDDLSNIDFPVDSVNGKTGNVQLSAADVGARPDTWKPTIAEIGAAPAGYGLGASVNWDYPSANDIQVTGFYACNVNVPSSAYWYGMHIRYDANSAYQYFAHAQQYYCAERRKINGVWQPWEWVNPPMTPGVEYRTTERWNGKAVYVQAFDFGALPASTDKSFILPVKVKATDMVRYEGVIISGYRRYDMRCFGYITQAFLNCSNNSYFWITTNSDLSSYTAKIAVWYTKD